MRIGNLIWVVCFCASASSAGVIFSDNFDNYAQGVLDKNAAASANPAPNGSGNPWWGPGTTPNMTVVGAQNGVSPLSGTNMIRGQDVTGVNSLVWNNIAYRQNDGHPYSGNLRYDFWFYDPLGATNGTTYEENSALAFYSDNPANTDYPASGTLSSSGVVERLTLGASNFRTNTSGFPEKYDSTKYQGRIVNYQGGYNSVGWFNTSLTRTVGWHHGRIDVGPAGDNNSNSVSFYIDDMNTSLLTANTVIDRGYSVLEFTSEGTAVGYFDDASLVTIPEPAAVSVFAFAPLLLRRGFTPRSKRRLAFPPATGN